MTMTTQQKISYLRLAAIALGVLAVIWYLYQCGIFSRPVEALIYAINPISIATQVTEPVTLILLAGIVAALTVRSAMKVRVDGEWRRAHENNDYARHEAADIASQRFALEKLNLTLPDKDFFALYNAGEVVINRASLPAGTPPRSMAATVHHEDDYGQILDALVSVVGDRVELKRQQ